MEESTRAPSEAPTGRRPEGSDKVKANKPDMWYGDRNKLKDWLHQVDLFFLFNPIPSNRQTLYATTYLRGQAQHWIQPVLDKVLDDGQDTRGMVADFKKFKKEITDFELLSYLQDLPDISSRTCDGQWFVAGLLRTS